MKKIDAVVIKETKYIFYVCALLGVLMQSVFLVIGKWDYTVLLANILSLVVSVGNFFLMGLSVQKATKNEEKTAKSIMAASLALRTFMIFTVAAVIALVPCFNIFSGLIPLFFPRIAIAIRPLFNKQ